MAKKRAYPTSEELMNHTGADVAPFVESVEGKVKLIPSVQELWEQLPTGITGNTSISNLDPGAKAYLAINATQARYWKTAYERRSTILKEMKIETPFEAAERKKLSDEALSLVTKEQNLAEASRPKDKGRGPIRSDYPWLAEWHDVPDLRRALGLSDEGMRGMCKALKIVPTKSGVQKGNVTRVRRAAAFRLLLQRLSAPRWRAAKEAQAILSNYLWKQETSNAAKALLWMLSGAYLKAERREPTVPTASEPTVPTAN